MRKHHRELGAGPWGARTTRLRRPRIAPLVGQRIPVHRIPHHVRDDRDTPLTGAERDQGNHNFRKNERELFLRGGLEHSHHLDAPWESRIFAHEIFVCRQSEMCGEIGTDLPGRCRAPPTSGCSRMKSGDGLGRMSACEVVLPISHRRQSCLR